MTHAQTADVRTGTTIPVMAAALAVVALVGAAIILAQAPSLDLRIGAPAAQDQALIQSGQAWEQQRLQQSSGGVVSAEVLQSGRDWESRYDATTPASAADFRGELHSAPPAQTESHRTPQVR